MSINDETTFSGVPPTLDTLLDWQRQAAIDRKGRQDAELALASERASGDQLARQLASANTTLQGCRTEVKRAHEAVALAAGCIDTLRAERAELIAMLGRLLPDVGNGNANADAFVNADAAKALIERLVG